MPDEPRGKDFWDKLDILVKGFLGVLVTGIITGFGFYLNSQQSAINAENSKIAEENRQARTLVQLVNSRETAMVQLRSEMFKSLLDKYLTGEDLDSKIAVLEMIGLNFRDAIQIKPLFEHLDHRLAWPGNAVADKTIAGKTIAGDMAAGNTADFETASGRAAETSPSEVSSGKVDTAPRTKLRNAAGRVIKDQLDQIRMTEDGAVCEMTLLKHEDAQLVPCLGNLKLRLSEVGDRGIRVWPVSSSANFRIEGRLAKDGFFVSYFDMPMVDFTSMDFGFGNIRYSVVLREASEAAGSATIAVAILPATALTKQNAYLFDELVAKKIGMIE